MPMKITVVSGSVRANSESRKVADYLVDRLSGADIEVSLADLNEQRLPLYDHSNEGAWQGIWASIEQELGSADGFVIVSPEWDGMFNVGLHNMFHYVTKTKKHVLAHKPVMLVGVSDGMGGAYPIAQLKAVGPKNTHYVVSPENLRISKVKEVLVDGEIVVDGVRERADYALKILVEYAKALKPLRDSGMLDFKKFGSGV